MDTILFNFHDLVLILTAFECLLFALLLYATREDQPKTTYFFIGFLLCHAFIPLHELTFWGKEFRLWMLDISPNIFFTGSYAYFIDGPLLFFFVRSLIYKDYHFQRGDLVHLIPLGFYILHMVFSFYSLSYGERYWLVESQHIAYSSPYLYFDSFGRFMRVAYAIACIVMVFNYKEQLKNYYANVNKVDISWLKMMLCSLLALFCWDAVLVLVKLWGLINNNFNLDLLNIMGLSAYYLTFSVLNLLIFLKFTHLTKVSSVHVKRKTPHTDELDDVTPEEIRHIEEAMLEEKIYQDSEINFDKLAAQLELPPKKLTRILKHHYEINFYEFINRYRIEEAKALLADPAYNHLTIVDIYCEVGFNSKSVFNTFFKSKVDMTPSEYRQTMQSSHSRKKRFSLAHGV